MAARLVSWSWCVCVAALLIAGAAAQTPVSQPPPTIVAIRNVTVIPATGAAAGAPITGATVVITGDRISAIGPASSTVIPKQARIVDG